MKVFLSFFIVSLIIKNAVGNDDDMMVGSLQTETMDEFNNLFKSDLIRNIKAVCRKVKGMEVNFLHYTRENPEEPAILDIENPTIQKGKKTILIIHNWLSSINSTHIINLKDAYLKRYDANVILMDWSQVSWQRYTTAFCSISRMSFFASKLLCNLKQQEIEMADVHVIGHGVGAHIAGVVGYYVKNKCTDPIGRITGLDPTGPLFQNAADLRKLDKGDALFVDVIHTDAFQIGYRTNMASADFWVNCAQLQPGCPAVRKIKNDTKINDVMCSQIRSLEYMAESVNSNNFVAFSCGFCPKFCRPDIMGGHEIMMGEECRANPKGTNKYVIRTRSSAPYHLGHTPLKY